MIELCCFDPKLKWVRFAQSLTGDALLMMHSINEASLIVIATSGTHAIVLMV